MLTLWHAAFRRLPVFWRFRLLAVVAAIGLWAVVVTPASADRIADGRNAYWEVDTEVKTDRPAFISVNLRASYYVRENVVVPCADGQLPEPDGQCRERRWVEQDEVPPLHPSTELDDVIARELWSPQFRRPAPNPNMGYEPPRIFCGSPPPVEASIILRWEVRYQGTMLRQFFTGDCPERIQQLCDLHTTFNGQLIARSDEYCLSALADRLYRQFPYPQLDVKLSPGVRGLTGLPTWYWVEGYDGRPLLASGCLPRAPLCVAVKLEPDAGGTPYAWSTGDPTRPTLTGASLGEPYLAGRGEAPPPPTAVTHTYERARSAAQGGYPVGLAITWGASWHLATMAGGTVAGFGHAMALPEQTRAYPGGPGSGGSWVSAPLVYEVVEVRSVRTDRP